MLTDNEIIRLRADFTAALPGTQHRLTNRIVTAGGRTDERSISILVRDL